MIAQEPTTESIVRRLALAILALIFAIAFLAYDLRAVVPTPGLSYVQRLRLYQGLESELGPYNPNHRTLNCSALITSAHRTRYMSVGELFNGGSGQLLLIEEVSSLKALREETLIAGDLAVFGDVHVAAYLGNGLWIDSDGRRGNIATFSLANKIDDPWFTTSSIRIFQWRKL